jgi:hypothetical protein
VTIEAGNKTDRVFYTTNRSEPTEDSRLYSAPITVTPGMTLRIRAFAPHAPPSEIVEFTYGVKGISPPPITTQPGVTPATRPAVGVGQ